MLIFNNNLSLKIIRTAGLLSTLLLLSINGWAQANTEKNVNDFITILKESTNHEERLIAARELTNNTLRDRELAIDVLEESVRNDDAQIAAYSAQALGSIGAPAAKRSVRTLIERLQDPGRDENNPDEITLVSRIIEAVVPLGVDEKEHILALCNKLNGKSLLMSKPAASALNNLTNYLKQTKPDLIPYVIPCLIQKLGESATKDNLDTLYNTAIALGSFSAYLKQDETRKAVEVLKKQLQDSSYIRIQGAAAGALRPLAPQIPVDIRASVITTLINVLNETPNTAKVNNEEKFSYSNSLRSIISALEQFGPESKDAVGPLQARLQDADKEVVRAAIQCLGKIRHEAKGSLPALIALLKQDNGELSVKIAQALLEIAQGLQNVGDTDPEVIKNLDEAVKVLSESNQPGIRNYAPEVKRSLDALKSSGWRKFYEAYQYPILVSASYLLLVLIWYVLLWLRPLWLLRINDALTVDVNSKWSAWLGWPFTIARYGFSIGFFHYRTRVLDAWVDKYARTVRDSFEQMETAKDHSIFIPVPVILNGKTVAELKGRDLKALFERKSCLLIWGEGGSGKTSLAFYIARAGMSSDDSESISDYSMLPVFISHELLYTFRDTSQPLLSAIKGQLQILIGETEPIDEELLQQLLKHRRVLVILDDLSKLATSLREKFNPASADFPIYALIITSRINENLPGIIKHTIEPLRIEGDRLSSFMEAYLTKCGKRQLFKDSEFFDACSRLSSITGQGNLTVLLAKLYADQIIAAKERKVFDVLPQNVPDLMLSYLNYLNRGFEGDSFTDQDVQRAAKVIAWECLKETYRPIVAPIQAVLDALKTNGLDQAFIQYFEKQLRLLQTVGPGHDAIQFTLDPLAEYMGALHLLETYGENLENWQAFLLKAREVSETTEEIKGFLLAIQDCYVTKRPASLVQDIIDEAIRAKAGTTIAIAS
jgi:HEAT repeat protein